MHHHRLIATVLALALITPVVGVAQQGPDPRPRPDLVRGPYNQADVTFMQGMIPHHAQAVEMSDLMLKKDSVPATVTSLATRIKAAQGPEIEKMTGWLKGWSQPTEVPSGMAGGHGMSGMMGDGDMAALKAAQGTEAARLFLTQMIAHHEGAVMMAKTESTDGKNPEAVQLAKDIVTAQETEILEMKDLLAAL